MNICGIDVTEANIRSIFILAMVVDKGGYAAADKHYGVPKSKLSRYINFLEDEIGEVLISRSTRRFEPTEKAKSITDIILSIGDNAEYLKSSYDRGYAAGLEVGHSKGVDSAVQSIKRHVSKMK